MRLIRAAVEAIAGVLLFGFAMTLAWAIVAQIFNGGR